jgi:hypothetical protein
MILATKAAIAHSGPTGLDYRWVAVALNGNLYTSDSTTASSWTSRTSSFGASDILNVASNGTDLYVAVGESGKLATSPDGITWTQQTSSFSTSNINAIAYGADGYWVAVGQSGKLATSTDGITWTQQSTGAGPSQIQSIAYGNGLWVFGAQSGFLQTASDPTSTWTTRTSTLTQYPFTYYAPDQGIWVSGADTGTTGALASSTNGTTWTARTSPFSLAVASLAPSFRALFASDAGIIVFAMTATIGGAGDVGSSTNGTTWTNRTPGLATVFVGLAVDDNGTFCIAAGLNGNDFQTSTNGTSWTQQTGSGVTGVEFRHLCHSSGMPSIR